MSVIVKIAKIQEDEFYYRDQFVNRIDDDKLTVVLNPEFNWDLKQEKFNITLEVGYDYKLKNQDEKILRFKLTIAFHVKGLKEILQVDDHGFEIEKEFTRLVVSTAISAARGMLTYKLSGTQLAEYYLPLVDVPSFMKHIMKAGAKKGGAKRGRKAGAKKGAKRGRKAAGKMAGKASPKPINPWDTEDDGPLNR